MHLSSLLWNEFQYSDFVQIVLQKGMCRTGPNCVKETCFDGGHLMECLGVGKLHLKASRWRWCKVIRSAMYSLVIPIIECSLQQLCAMAYSALESIVYLACF